MKKFTRRLLYLLILQMILLLCSYEKNANMERDNSNGKLSYKDSTNYLPMSKAKSNSKRVDIHCGKDIDSYVIKKESNLRAEYEIHQELDQTVTYMDLKITENSASNQYSYIMQIQKDFNVQKLKWNSNVKIYPDFVDVNNDGYIDLLIGTEEGIRSTCHDLYIWKSATNQYKKVKFDNIMTDDTIGDFSVYDGYIINWFNGLIQKYIWNDDRLVKVYEDYCNPDEDEKVKKRKGETTKTVKYGKIKFTLPKDYHIEKETDYVSCKLYDCKINKNISKSPAIFTIMINESIKMNLSNNKSVMDYFSFYDDTFRTYTAYRNIKDTSGIKNLFVAEGIKHTYYYIQYKDCAYTIRTENKELVKCLIKN